MQVNNKPNNTMEQKKVKRNAHSKPEPNHNQLFSTVQQQEHSMVRYTSQKEAKALDYLLSFCLSPVRSRQDTSLEFEASA